MAITRAQLETELVARRQSQMSTVSMAVTFAGANADLNSPVGYAIRQSGGTVANPSSVADSDLSTFADSDFDQLADYAEYRLLINIKGRWGKVDIRSGPFSQSLSQFADQLDKDIESLASILDAAYGSALEAGVIDLNFQQTDEDAGL